MKSIRFLSISLAMAAWFLSGCASDSPSRSAKIPPASGNTTSTRVEPEVAPTSDSSVSASTTSSSSSTTTSTASTSSSSNDSTAAASTGSAPMDSGSVIPLKDIPTVKVKGQNYPYAIKTKWPGLVKSPYAQDKTLVDVSTLSSGGLARCPHTGKIFVVP